jgi:Arc/MetJ family transcription regulator
MLDDALAAIVVRALRTAANRLAVGMMKTTLLGKCGDGGVLTVERLRAASGARIGGDG